MSKEIATSNEVIAKLRELIDLPDRVLKLELRLIANEIAEVECRFYPTKKGEKNHEQ